MNERAAIACDPSHSRGRLHPEEAENIRSPFQRDRDRIIHCSAFRRLKHKTQVFVANEGDHYRTRLTHSLEVAQIARTLARALGLDEDLTEALALAHDLGHTPFGHAGEQALDECMKDYGGFDHNAQTLRIVTSLERRYAAFDGLNLTWETLEGLVKHNGPLTDERGRPVGRYGDKGLPLAVRQYVRSHDLELHSWPSAEAQVAALADDIAYNAHDVDDGLRAGLFDVIDLGDLPLAGPALADALKLGGGLERNRLVHEMVRRMISAMVRDVLARTRRNIGKTGIKDAAGVRSLGRPLVEFSAQMNEDMRVLQLFLKRNMYEHPRVRDVMGRARRILRDLFLAYMEDPALLPGEWRDGAIPAGEAAQARQVCDFIAGMTDQYAIMQHRKLFDLYPLFR